MLVLASASPRRRELLTQAGFSFVVHPAHIPEDPLPDEDPIAYVTRLAREKAQFVYDEIQANPALALSLSKSLTGQATNDHASVPRASAAPQVPQVPQVLGAPGPVSGTWGTTTFDRQSLAVLGADTTVFFDHHILGKPENAADAARMLRLLSGRTHQVATGIALVSAHCAQAVAEVTTVGFLPLTDAEIDAYIATGEPMDKAGAYAIQGRAARWIPRIEGCYFNVVGLPIARVTTLLK
jgi:septum formation protein